MSKFLFSNGAKTTVNGSLTQGGTVLVLAFNTGNFFPSPTEGNFFYGTLYEKDLAGIETRIEVVKVINRVADTLTLERDVETLTGQVGGFFYPSGAGATVYFELRVTAGVMQGLVQTADQILALESKSDTDHTHTELYEPKNANIQAHLVSATNPHGVTRAQVGLGNVDNTSDANKPVSNATQTALSGKADSTHNHSVEDVTGLQTTLAGKAATSHNHTNVYEPVDATILRSADINTSVQAVLQSGITLKTVGGTSLLGSGDVPLNTGLLWEDLTTSTHTAVAGYAYRLGNVATSTLTLPSAPVNGDTVGVKVANGLLTNLVDPNGSSIEGVSEILTLDSAVTFLVLRYTSSRTTWEIVA